VISHVILFNPKPELTEAARRELLDALVAASVGIPSIRKFRVGRRVKHGLPGYEQFMSDDYGFAAIVEFDDMDGLKEYLAHPSHAAIGRHFMASADRSLAYDYTLVDAADVGRLID
jgi:stress responsive alpha/beta barrel protein